MDVNKFTLADFCKNLQPYPGELEGKLKVGEAVPSVVES
jgi:hypothetical protein